jgi:glutathione peroxidase
MHLATHLLLKPWLSLLEHFSGARMNRRCFVSVLAALLCIAPALAQKPSAKEPGPAKQSVYDFSLVDMSGNVIPLSTYKGKVLLIVNLASQSFYSTQIAALNDLQKTYGPRGLQVIGIPSSDFGNEELKDPAAMRAYYTQTEKVDFPVFAKASITGINAIPLYQFLCDPKQSVPGGPLRWNYTKFLIGRDGHPIARYELDTDPANIDFHVSVETALNGKSKMDSSGGASLASGRRHTHGQS